MTIKSIVKKAVLGTAAMGALGVPLVLATAPAEASSPPYFYKSCNSANSDDWITEWNGKSGYTTYGIGIGQCRQLTAYYVPDVRVDVDPAGNVDIDAYQIGHNGYGYGPQHIGETNTSNPPDSYADTGYRYRTCTGDHASYGGCSGSS